MTKTATALPAPRQTRGLRIRTKTTKEVERLSFEKLSTWSIFVGASKVIWQRHSEIFWITGFWTLFAALIWIKLGE